MDLLELCAGVDLHVCSCHTAAGVWVATLGGFDGILTISAVYVQVCWHIDPY